MSMPFDPFSELDQLQRTKCRNGLTFEELGAVVHSVYHKIVSTSVPVLHEADKPPWACVAGKAASIIDLPESDQGETSVSARALAKALYNQYTIECDRIPNWEEVSPKEKVAWEAVGRHLANLIDSDGVALDFPELEFRILYWAEERLQPQQLVLS